jgi:phage major head subunit gpT-like protein
MGAQSLSSRAIVGSLIKRIEEATVASWVGDVSWLNADANQEIETYKWLGEVPSLREWTGGRQAHGLKDFGVAIESKEYEATLEVLRRELRLDKTGQIDIRIGELAAGAARHWAQLLSPLIANGAASAATYGTSSTYDGVDFFGNGHRDSQDNEIGATAATAARPTTAEMVTGILVAVEAMMGFTDEQGEPANEGLSSIHIMGPTKYWGPLQGALRSLIIQGSGGSIDNVLTQMEGITFSGSTNTRLDASFGASNKMAVFRTDNLVKPFIRQEEDGLVVDAIAEGSEEEIKNNRHLYGIRATRGVGYGLWEHAVEVTFA